MFLAEDGGILRLLAEKGRAGVNIRIALRDLENSNAAERGEEDIGDAVLGKHQKAHELYRSVAVPEHVEIRLHQIVLYNFIYRADDQLFVNQRAYGVPAAHAPVFCLRDIGSGEMGALYRESFEHVWARAIPQDQAPRQIDPVETSNERLQHFN